MSPALSNLIKSLKRLSMSYEQQIAYLQEIGLSEQGVDELALEFDDHFRSVPALLERGEISEETAIRLKYMDNCLAALDNNFECWTPQALRHDSRWEDVRVSAAACLKMLCS